MGITMQSRFRQRRSGRCTIMILAITACVLAAVHGLANGQVGPPKVIKASPDNGEVDVDAVKVIELRVTFDQAMNTTGASWVGGGETFPKATGKPRWQGDRTCVLPVQLEA